MFCQSPWTGEKRRVTFEQADYHYGVPVVEQDPYDESEDRGGGGG